MAYSSTETKRVRVGGGIFKIYYTATDVQTSGANTIVTPFRKIYGISVWNKTRAAAGGLKMAVSAGTITLTGETNDDDFELGVEGSY